MKLTTCGLLLVFAGRALAGDFVNLNFDSPVIKPNLPEEFPGGPRIGAVADILPGWAISVGGTNLTSIGVAPSGVQPGKTPDLVAALPGSFAVGYYLDLTRGSPGSASEVRLSQTGMIYSSAPVFQYTASGFVNLYIDGEAVEIASGAGPHAVDLSRFAGRNVTLELVLPSGNSAGLDARGFVSVPEPSMYALIGVALGMIGAFRCIVRRR